MDSDQVGLLPLGSELTSEAGSSVDKPSSSDLTSDDAASSIEVDRAVSSTQVDRAVSSEVTSQAVSSIESQGPAAVPCRPSHQPQLAIELSNALLQQLLSLTPEQIDLLPLEQSTHVRELQQKHR